MEFQDLILRFAVALAIGLLVGLERGWRTREETSGSRAAGIRTFAISGLLGGVLGALAIAMGGAAAAGGIVIGIGFAAYAAVIAAFCLDENRADKTYSATTAIAAMATFALGAYTLVGDVRVGAAGAVAVALVLAMRESLHGWVANITWPELRSALVLLAMTVIALPIVPDAAIGPYDNVNPREIWLIAIVLAGVSFAGYVAVKYLGTTHGTLLAGAAGGLVSSTAVTITNARRASGDTRSSRILAAGVALASGVMFLRVLVITAVLNASLIALLAPTLLIAALAAVAYALIAGYWRGRDEAAVAGDRVSQSVQLLVGGGVCAVARRRPGRRARARRNVRRLGRDRRRRHRGIVRRRCHHRLDGAPRPAAARHAERRAGDHRGGGNRHAQQGRDRGIARRTPLRARARRDGACMLPPRRDRALGDTEPAGALAVGFTALPCPSGHLFDTAPWRGTPAQGFAGRASHPV